MTTVAAAGAGQSLGERAFALTVETLRQPRKDPLAPFRDEMMHAARQGLFSVHIELCEQHGPASYFLHPRNQNDIGDAFKMEGVRCAFGSVDKVTGYPSMFVDWFKTRRVVKIARRVRLKKAALIHEQNRGSDDGDKAVVKSASKNKQKKKRRFDVNEDEDFEEFVAKKTAGQEAVEQAAGTDNSAKGDGEGEKAPTVVAPQQAVDIDVHSEEEEEEGANDAPVDKKLMKPSYEDRAGIVSPLKTSGSSMADFIRARRTAENLSKNKVSKGITKDELENKEQQLIDAALKAVKTSADQRSNEK